MYQLCMLYINSSLITGLLVEKESTIQELRETVEILGLKIKKLEQLVRLKESKITTLQAKLQQHGIR